MTFKVLTDKMSTITYRSELLSRLYDQKKNLHAVMDSPLKAAGVPSVSRSTNEDEYKTCAKENRPMLCFNTDDLIGRMSVLNEQEDGARYHERTVEPFEEDDVTHLSDLMLRNICWNIWTDLHQNTSRVA
jgi:hypothetical protein